MSDIYWAACHTQPGAELRAREGIEALGRGTFLPTYVRRGVSRGRYTDVERPLLSRYVFVALSGQHDDIWGTINAVDGVDRMLAHEQLPSRVTDAEVSRLMMAHVFGTSNVVQSRAANGQFGQGKRKHKKRRRRPGHGKVCTGARA